MIKLRSDKNNIIVLGEPDSEIFNWEHRIFFTTISGYQLNEELNQYIFSDKTNLIKSIKQTISYLIEENIAFEADEQISSIISKINNEQSEFEKARDAKISIVDNKVLSISPIFVRPLRQHQIQGIEHLKNIRHGANFSVPGSGKTTVIYAVFARRDKTKKLRSYWLSGQEAVFGPGRTNQIIASTTRYLQFGSSARKQADRALIYRQENMTCYCVLIKRPLMI